MPAPSDVLGTCDVGMLLESNMFSPTGCRPDFSSSHGRALVETCVSVWGPWVEHEACHKHGNVWKTTRAESSLTKIVVLSTTTTTTAAATKVALLHGTALHWGPRPRDTQPMIKRQRSYRSVVKADSKASGIHPWARNTPSVRPMLIFTKVGAIDSS